MNKISFSFVLGIVFHTVPFYAQEVTPSNNANLATQESNEIIKDTRKPFIKEVEIPIRENKNLATKQTQKSTIDISKIVSKSEDDMQGPFIIVDENLDSILIIIEALFQKTIIRGDNLPKDKKFNFSSKRKLSRDDSIMALRALLMLNGIAIVPIDDKFLKAVSSANVSTQIPEFLRTSSLNLPPSQDFYTKFLS